MSGWGYVVNSIFTSRSYWLRTGDNTCCVVDIGDVGSLLESIPSGLKVEALLLTHVHFDHIYGLAELKSHFPDIRIYTNEWGREALADDKLNMSRYHGTPLRYQGDDVCSVSDGDVICIDDCMIKVHETPGHNPSCICYEVGGLLFTGDAYIPGVKVVTTLPHADKLAATCSLEMIKALSKDKVVLPGHEI